VNSKTKFNIGAIIGAGALSVALAMISLDTIPWTQLAFWTGFCLIAEFFWVRSLDGKTVNSLAASARLATLFLLGPLPALPVVFASTCLGNMIIRKSAWYKAAYNASQLTLAAAAAGVVYLLFTPPILGERLTFSGGAGLWIVETMSSPGVLISFILAGVVYKTANTLFMTWLIHSMTGVSVTAHLKQNHLTPEEFQGTSALVITPLLLILLYGVLGALGLLLYFAVLSLELVANGRYVALVNAQDNLVRTGRMAAMGELSEEVGVTLGDYLEELRARTQELAERARSTEDEKMARSVDIIHTNVDHMSTLIEGITAFTHQETRKAGVDLNAMLEKTIEFVRPQNRFDKVEFRFLPDPDLGEAHMDGGQIQQVIINLLANAADAMQEADSPDRVITVTTRLDPRKNRIQIHVTDTGPGILKPHLARIFEPHFTTKETGHGFGLSTAFRIAENHHGSIQATNGKDGGGAEFLLELPAA